MPRLAMKSSFGLSVKDADMLIFRNSKNPFGPVKLNFLHF
jgi:hypothetical protein